MRKLAVLLLTVLGLFSIGTPAQDHKVRFFVYNSTKPSGTMLKGLQDHCRNAILTINPANADYSIQAQEAEHAEAKTQIVLYDKNGDSLFRTETQHEENAMKDVCTFLKIAK